MSSDSFWKTSLGSTAPGAWHLHAVDGCSVEEIGRSRQGRAIYGLVTGGGPLHVSIVAGAHADEPAGPRAAVRLADAIARAEHAWARELTQRASFRIVPHVNPDGDARNAPWQHHRGDFEAYLRHCEREQPADDVEFHYPRDATDRDTRPENLAVADFLRDGAPYGVHASLHSMGVAEGAWFLVCREWAERARRAGMFERLANLAGRAGLALHDMDRRGEKGFHRLAPGFCTTPRSDAMREFFRAQGDEQTAAHFRPSSMEFVQSLGGDPLCVVSEMPYFELRSARESDAPLDKRPYFALRAELPAIRAALQAGDRAPLDDAIRRYAIAPVAWERQMELQVALVREAIRCVEG